MAYKLVNEFPVGKVYSNEDLSLFLIIVETFIKSQKYIWIYSGQI